MCRLRRGVISLKKVLFLAVLLTFICGCTLAQLRFWRSMATKGGDLVDHPLVDATPLAPFAGLLGGLFMIVRNITEQRIRAKGGEVKVSPGTGIGDTRNVLSKISGSRKYVVATLVSAIIVAIVNWYKLEIDPATVAKIVAALFGTAIVLNGVEDAAEKLKS